MCLSVTRSVVPDWAGLCTPITFFVLLPCSANHTSAPLPMLPHGSTRTPACHPHLPGYASWLCPYVLVTALDWPPPCATRYRASCWPSLQKRPPLQVLGWPHSKGDPPPAIFTQPHATRHSAPPVTDSAPCAACLPLLGSHPATTSAPLVRDPLRLLCPALAQPQVTLAAPAAHSAAPCWPPPLSAPRRSGRPAAWSTSAKQHDSGKRQSVQWDTAASSTSASQHSSLANVCTDHTARRFPSKHAAFPQVDWWTSCTLD
jgi:hypothetical protein